MILKRKILNLDFFIRNRNELIHYFNFTDSTSPLRVWLKRIKQNKLCGAIYSIKSFLLFLTFLLLSSSAEASKYYQVIFDSGRKFAINSETLNGKDYFNLQQYSKMVFPKSKFNKQESTISFEDTKIRFLGGSFYVISIKNNDRKAAQLLTPIIQKKAVLLAPVVQFFQSLEVLGLFDIDVVDNKIYLKKVEINKEPVPENIIERKISDNFDRTSKILFSSKGIENKVEKQEDELINKPVINDKYLKPEKIKNIEEKPIKIPKEIIRMKSKDKFPEAPVPPYLYNIPKGLFRRELYQINMQPYTK